MAREPRRDYDRDPDQPEHEQRGRFDMLRDYFKLRREGATDGRTHCRKYEGGQWVSVGKPMLYGVNNVGHADAGNHMSYYGDGSQSPR